MIETILNNLHLEKILWIIKKKLALMVIFGALGGMLGGTYAFLTNTTVYRAEVSFYVYSNPDYVYDSSVNISNAEFTQAKNLLQSYILIMKSDTVMQKVIDEVGLQCTTEELAGSISSRVIENTAVFYVYVYHQNPYSAMEIANAVAQVAPAEISRIVKSGGIEVVDYATLPLQPYSSTSLVKFMLLGFAGGFVLSAALFMFLGLLDTTIRRRYELKLAFNIPVLGDVPMMTAPSKKVKVDKILSADSPFAMKESYNAIRANLLFTGRGEKCPVYVITSADQNEGKTLNSINLAIGYAQLGKRVLLIDGDMRNSSVAHCLGLNNHEGLSKYLAGINDSVTVQEAREGLFVIPGGAVPPNPSELLAGRRMEELLEQMKEQYDTIIIDMPPVGIVTDALLLAKLATAYILVVRAYQSRMGKEKGAVAMLEQVGANICGFIFNGLNPKSEDYNYKSYQYNYSYGGDGDGSDGGKKRRRSKKQK